MKKIYLSLFILAISWNVQAQLKDTLRNLTEDSLRIDRYAASAGWGFWTGHNYLGRQQFAEKYYISGEAKVLGVISHLTGTVGAGTPDSSAFNVWTVGSDKFPAEKVASKVVKNVDLDVSGDPYAVSFDAPVSVSDSFFVAFDLYDYSHHAHPDTLAILYGQDGTRAFGDKFGRNVIQVHSHGTPVWRDFATQNFTNINTHLAIYPIVEFPTTTDVRSPFAATEGLQLHPAYPNPCIDQINLRFYLSRSSEVQLEVITAAGQMVYRSDKGRLQGEVTETLAVDRFVPGSYLYLIHTEYGSLAGRFSVL